MSSMNPKSQRSTDGRHQRGQVTRAKIVEGARGAFLEREFSGTTMAEIARRAGVSEPTVYYSFASKEQILVAALEEAIAGPSGSPLIQQQWIQDALHDPDPLGQLDKMVRGSGEILRRSAGLVMVSRVAAAAGNDALADLGAARLNQRLDFQRMCVSALAKKTPLRSTLSEDKAAQIGVTLLSPENYQLLTADFGWAHDEWCAWVRDCLIREWLPG